MTKLQRAGYLQYLDAATRCHRQIICGTLMELINSLNRNWCYSQLIMHCCCSTNNRSTTVLSLFEEGIATYSLPLKVRTDRGGENSCAWTFMTEKHLKTNAVLVGSSLHNQRIEKFNRDKFCISTSTYLHIWKRERAS